jgi:RNA-directed DNA polymerase
MLLDYLSKNLILEREFIELIANTSSRRYKKYEITKNKKTRTIFHPAKELKTLQRILHDCILSKLPVHSAATAYCQNSTILANAERHKSSKFMLRIDFKNFFESISKDDIVEFITKNQTYLDPSWSDEDTQLLVKIACFHKRLTIGSVTSPIISNAICYELDHKLSQYCLSKNIIYTRYADDLFFSTNSPNILKNTPSVIKKTIREISQPNNLWINYRKTIHMSKKSKMCITGLTITNDQKISIGNKKKREIRSLVYKWNHLDSTKKANLQGYLSYCSSVEPSFINSLYIKYGATHMDLIKKFK